MSLTLHFFHAPIHIVMIFSSLLQVDVVEWRSRIWNEALRSQGVEDMELARVKAAKQSLAYL